MIVVFKLDIVVSNLFVFLSSYMQKHNSGVLCYVLSTERNAYVVVVSQCTPDDALRLDDDFSPFSYHSRIGQPKGNRSAHQSMPFNV
jgi:hypothetical protein